MIESPPTQISELETKEAEVRDRRESGERYFGSASTLPLHKRQLNLCIGYRKGRRTVFESFGALSFQLLVA